MGVSNHADRLAFEQGAAMIMVDNIGWVYWCVGILVNWQLIGTKIVKSDASTLRKLCSVAGYCIAYGPAFPLTLYVWYRCERNTASEE
jgi:hypothetical protein